MLKAAAAAIQVHEDFPFDDGLPQLARGSLPAIVFDDPWAPYRAELAEQGTVVLPPGLFFSADEVAAIDQLLEWIRRAGVRGGRVGPRDAGAQARVE
jgi:hypothetical protein